MPGGTTKNRSPSIYPSVTFQVVSSISSNVKRASDPRGEHGDSLHKFPGHKSFPIRE